MAGSSKVKLLRVVETELLQKYETDLLEKENSGCAALLRDDKVSSLSGFAGSSAFVFVAYLWGGVVVCYSLAC